MIADNPTFSSAKRFSSSFFVWRIPAPGYAHFRGLLFCLGHVANGHSFHRRPLSGAGLNFLRPILDCRDGPRILLEISRIARSRLSRPEQNALSAPWRRGSALLRYKVV